MPRTPNPDGTSWRRPTLAVRDDGDLTVLDFGGKHGWDGADLHLLRETLLRLFRSGVRRFGVDMRHVTYLPGGTFALLADTHDLGTELLLLDPTDRVRRMLWFRQYAEGLSEGVWRLTAVQQEEFTAAGAGGW